MDAKENFDKENLNAVDENGNSQIMNAGKNGDLFLFTALARRREVDLCIRNNNDETVMDICEKELEKACEKYDYQMTTEEKRVLEEEISARKQILKVLKVRVHEELVEFAKRKESSAERKNMQDFTLDHLDKLGVYVPTEDGAPTAYYNHDPHSYERV